MLIVTGKKQLTREEVVSLMRSLQGDRTAAAFAEELEISPSYLSDIYAGKRDPGPSVLEKLGFETVTVYKPSDSNAAD